MKIFRQLCMLNFLKSKQSMLCEKTIIISFSNGAYRLKYYTFNSYFCTLILLILYKISKDRIEFADGIDRPSRLSKLKKADTH